MPAPIAVPIAMAAASLIGSGLNAWSNWKGAQKGAKAQAEANRMNIDLFREETATNIREKAKDRRFREEEQKREFGQRNFETFLDRITTMFNSRPQITKNLVALQRARGR